jgi:hypothetical protein
MNVRPLHRFLASVAILFCVFLVPSPRATAQLTTKFYYLLGPGAIRPSAPDESFAIEVNATQAAQIETILKTSGRAGFSGAIAAGSVDYNRNYSAPGQPVWNWHVASVTQIFDFSTTLFPACQCPFLIAKPSEIAANPDEWIKQNGTLYTPIGYVIQRRIDPAKREAIANVSNRGVTGQGERKLITGLIITGGTPRNIVIRVLGPSLSAAGVGHAAANPKLEVYQDATRISTNADWKDDPRADFLAQNFPALVPANDKEAALWLTLFPGNYTIQASNEDGTEGIVLIEAYDVDSTAP